MQKVKVQNLVVIQEARLAFENKELLNYMLKVDFRDDDGTWIKEKTSL